MPTDTKRKRQWRQGPRDALAMLMADHKEGEETVFRAVLTSLRKEGSDEDKSAIVNQICNELKIQHGGWRKEIFYPSRALKPSTTQT